MRRRVSHLAVPDASAVSVRYGHSVAKVATFMEAGELMEQIGGAKERELVALTTKQLNGGILSDLADSVQASIGDAVPCLPIATLKDGICQLRTVATKAERQAALKDLEQLNTTASLLKHYSAGWTKVLLERLQPIVERLRLKHADKTEDVDGVKEAAVEDSSDGSLEGEYEALGFWEQQAPRSLAESLVQVSTVQGPKFSSPPQIETVRLEQVSAAQKTFETPSPIPQYWLPGGQVDIQGGGE